jgi:regulator of cell morphogenesis and NO signaling
MRLRINFKNKLPDLCANKESMTNYTGRTLAEIVKNNHKAVPVFEKFNLDFCCKGKRTLQEACHEKSIDIAAVENELGTMTAADNCRQMPFTEMSAEQLISHIVVKHHFYVKQTMPRIQTHIQKVAMKHGDRFPNMLEVAELFTGINEDMTQHMAKEEQVLFPRIIELERVSDAGGEHYIHAGFISGPVQLMETEHDRAGEMLYRIRSLTDNYTIPEGACTTFQVTLAELKEFEEDLHEHVHLENNILFPKAVSQLSSAVKQ